MNESESLREIAEARVLQAESDAVRAVEAAWGSDLTHLLDGCQVELNQLGEAWSAAIVEATRDFVAQIDDIDDAASQERRDVLHDAIYKTTTLLKALPHHFANLALCEAHKAAAQVEALGAALHKRKTDTRSRELQLLEQCSSVPENVRNALDEHINSTREFCEVKAQLDLKRLQMSTLESCVAALQASHQQKCRQMENENLHLTSGLKKALAQHESTQSTLQNCRAAAINRISRIRDKGIKEASRVHQEVISYDREIRQRILNEYETDSSDVVIPETDIERDLLRIIGSPKSPLSLVDHEEWVRLATPIPIPNLADWDFIEKSIVLGANQLKAKARTAQSIEAVTKETKALSSRLQEKLVELHSDGMLRVAIKSEVELEALLEFVYSVTQANPCL